MSEAIGLRERLGFPATARILMAAGDYTPGDGMRMAVWAFDVLKYAAPDLHLVLVGDGPGRERVLSFARALGSDDYRVHFLTDDSPASVVSEVDIVWGTHPRGGAAFLKAALAVGKPAIAMRTPDTERLTGALLTPAGDPVALATATRMSLDVLAGCG